MSVSKTELVYHQTGHTKNITKIVQIDGFIFTGDASGKICVWDKVLFKEIACIYAHNSSIRTIEKIPSLPIFLTSAQEKVIKLWAIDKKFKQIASFNAHAGNVFKVIGHKDYFFSIGTDNYLKKWEIKGNKVNLVRTLKVENIENFFIISDFILLTTSDGLISLHDIDSLALIKYLKFSEQKLVKAAKLAVRTYDSFKGHTEFDLLQKLIRKNGIPISSLLQLDEFFLIVHYFGLISFWKLKKLKCYDAAFLHSNYITEIQKMGDDTIVTCSLDFDVKIWDFNTHKALKQRKLKYRPLAMLISEDKNIVIGTEQGHIFVFNKNLEELKHIERITKITSACLTPKHLLFGFENGTITSVGLDNLQSIINKKLHNKAVSYIHYYNDKIATVGDDNKILLLNLNLEAVKSINVPFKLECVYGVNRYIVLSSNQLLDILNETIVKGTVSTQTKDELEYNRPYLFEYAHGDAILTVFLDRLKHIPSKEKNVSYSSDIVQAAAKLVKTSVIKYKRISNDVIVDVNYTDLTMDRA